MQAKVTEDIGVRNGQQVGLSARLRLTERTSQRRNTGLSLQTRVIVS
jgi:hypothetical protein